MSNRQYYSLDALLQSPKGSKGWFAYREVNLEEARQIQEKTGVDVRGYVHAIERDAINHIFIGHGKAKNPNEIPITEDDIRQIPQIVDSYDDL